LLRSLANTFPPSRSLRQSPSMSQCSIALLLLGFALKASPAMAARHSDMDMAIDLDFEAVSAGLVAHSSELLRKYANFSMNEAKVRSVLAQKTELHGAVHAHLAHLESQDMTTKDAYMKLSQLRMKLKQRAQNDLKDVGVKLDASTGSKTQCRCFVEGVKFQDSKLKLVDLDEESVHFDHCSHGCFEQCNSDYKYKFDPDEARVLGAEIGGISRKVAQCEDGECKCLDATQSKDRLVHANAVLTWLNENRPVKMDVVRVPNPHAGMNSAPNEYDDEDDCLRSCKYSCNDMERGSIEIDLEAMCIDEWH